LLVDVLQRCSSRLLELHYGGQLWLLKKYEVPIVLFTVVDFGIAAVKVVVVTVFVDFGIAAVEVVVNA
jgi:hypothetical protein